MQQSAANQAEPKARIALARGVGTWRQTARVVFGAGVALLVVMVVACADGIRLNLTGSIPPGLYRLRSGPPQRGTTILACLPVATARFARDRGYVPSGSCEDGIAPVGKVVAAIAGDVVEVSALGVAVNGTLLRNSAPLARDSRGRSLPVLRLPSHAVPKGEIWRVSSYSAQSFDSRYFGGISTSRVRSRIEPLFGP